MYAAPVVRFARSASGAVPYDVSLLHPDDGWAGVYFAGLRAYAASFELAFVGSGVGGVRDIAAAICVLRCGSCGCACETAVRGERVVWGWGVAADWGGVGAGGCWGRGQVVGVLCDFLFCSLSYILLWNVFYNCHDDLEWRCCGGDREECGSGELVG